MAIVSPSGVLGDYFTLQRGTTYKSTLLDLPGPFLLGLASIARNGGFRADSLRTYGGISPDKLILRPDDLYVALKDVTQSADLLGAVARVPKEIHLGRLTQDTVKLIFKRGKENLSAYIYWLLRTPQYRAYCRARAIGTTNLSMTREDFLSFETPALSPERIQLVKILEALEQKIRLNRRMNETLEAIARAIFKSWFIDVVTVSTAVGTVPFSSIATISREAVNPSDYPTENFDHYSIPAFDEGRLPTSEAGTQIKSNKFAIREDSVLLSKLNPRIPRVWMPLLNAGRRAICSTEFLVLNPKRPYGREFIYNLCTSQSFLDEFTTMVTGTSGSHQRVKPEYLEQMEVLKPDEWTLERYIDLVRPLHSKVLHNLRERSVLASLRDALLPKLMSGEIRIKQAQEIIEAHA